MYRHIILTLLSFSFLFSENANHVIFNKITILPNEAEMVSIFNPTESAIDLSDYYISDAEYNLINKNYYNLPSGNDFWTGYSSDFIIRFPLGLIINPGETLTIGLHEESIFESYYGVLPDLTLANNMLNAIDGDDTIGNGDNLLGDSYEVLIMFKWDGNPASLVQDVDYFYWGNAQGLPLYGVDKTGVLTYLPDTPFNIQELNIISTPHSEGEAYVRKSSVEDGESGPQQNNVTGNGITGHDETSESFIDSWEIKEHEIAGCLDELACNYLSNANIDSGNCEYPNFGYDCDEVPLYDENSDSIAEFCPLIDDPFYNEDALQFCSNDLNGNFVGDCCIADAVTHTIKEIVTGSSVGYSATILGLIVDFGDYREPNNGPQVITLQDDQGYRIDLVVWDWDVAESVNVGKMIDPNSPTEYKIIAEGMVDLYNNSYQFEVAFEEDILEYKSFNLEGEKVDDEDIKKAEINPAPFVIIPTLGEKLDYSFSFPSNSRVTVRILDFNGNLITSLVDKYYEVGGTISRTEDNSEWDGKNHLSQIVPPGTYFMHIEAINLTTGESTSDIAPVVVGVY